MQVDNQTPKPVEAHEAQKNTLLRPRSVVLVYAIAQPADKPAMNIGATRVINTDDTSI